MDKSIQAAPQFDSPSLIDGVKVQDVAEITPACGSAARRSDGRK